MKLTSVVIIAAGASVGAGLYCLSLYRNANDLVVNRFEEMDSKIQLFSIIEKGRFGTRPCFYKSPPEKGLPSSAGTVLTLDWNRHNIVLPLTIRGVLFNLLSATPVD